MCGCVHHCCLPAAAATAEDAPAFRRAENTKIIIICCACAECIVQAYSNSMSCTIIIIAMHQIGKKCVSHIQKYITSKLEIEQGTTNRIISLFQ